MAGPTVYFARAGTDGPIKIGYTSGEPSARIAALQTGCPWPLSLVGSMHGSLEDESRLHTLFAGLRIEGEWFSPEELLLEGIQQLLNGTFEWPVQEQSSVRQLGSRTLTEQPSISDIIWAAGGANRIAAASKGQIALDAVYKWRRNGIRDWHWALLMSLCSVSVEQLYQANLAAARSASDIRDVA